MSSINISLLKFISERIDLIVVVFPAPFLPINPVTYPFGIENEISPNLNSP